MKLLLACLVFLAAASFTSAQLGVSWYTCGLYNPCGKSSTEFYYPTDSLVYFIQCGLTAQQCFYKMCSYGTVWNQLYRTCVHDANVPPPAPVRPVWPYAPYINGTFNCGSKNPCTAENAAANKFYFPHDTPYVYIHCDNFQKCFIRYCNNGQVWDAAGYTCVTKP